MHCSPMTCTRSGTVPDLTHFFPNGKFPFSRRRRQQVTLADLEAMFGRSPRFSPIEDPNVAGALVRAGRRDILVGRGGAVFRIQPNIQSSGKQAEFIQCVRSARAKKDATEERGCRSILGKSFSERQWVGAFQEYFSRVKKGGRVIGRTSRLGRTQKKGVRLTTGKMIKVTKRKGGVISPFPPLPVKVMKTTPRGQKTETILCSRKGKCKKVKLKPETVEKLRSDPTPSFFTDVDVLGNTIKEVMKQGSNIEDLRTTADIAAEETVGLGKEIDELKAAQEQLKQMGAGGGLGGFGGDLLNQILGGAGSFLGGAGGGFLGTLMIIMLVGVLLFGGAQILRSFTGGGGGSSLFRIG